MDAHDYKSIAVTIAQHPSETDERMMVRLLAYVLHESERLIFGKGLSNDDEPALWEKSLSDEIVLWIDVGLPDKERVRKASHKADQVLIYVYGSNNATTWWQQNQKELKKFSNLSIFQIPADTSLAMSALADRSMNLTCMIQDGVIWLSNESDSVEIQLQPLL